MSSDARRSWFERALERIPGGVDSPVRSFSSVGGEPFFVAHGDGASLVDTEGNRYLDYVQSWGASILGHANPGIVEAVQRAAAEGTSFGAPTRREVELAEAISDAVPSVEKVRLVSSGTEAGMTAVRLARGATGRPKILKFAGCYHGHTDALLVAAGSGVATLGLPGSAGVTDGTVADTIVAPYNDDEALDLVFAESGAELAAVLVEPVAANMGLVPPSPGFLDGLRHRCTEAGALLVFDEVITGFRLGRGGAQGALRVAPDLTMFGKVIGGGLPLAALGGRADVMDELAPLGPVYQAGTLSGNPLATAAGLAAIAQLDDAAYVELEARATRFAGDLRDALASAGAKATVTQVGTLTGVFFSPTPVTNYVEAQAADHERYGRFFHALLGTEPRVFLAPSGYETLFVSLAHGDAELDATADGVRAARPPTLDRLTVARATAASSSRRRRLRRTWSMKNRLAGDPDDHHHHEHEREPAAAVLAAGVDELLRAAGAASATSADARPRRAARTERNRRMVTPSPGRVRAGGAAAAAASASCSSFSRQCSMSRPSTNRMVKATKATNGGNRSEPRSRVEDHEARSRRRRRTPAAAGQADRSASSSSGSTSQNCTTAYCGWCVNSSFQNCGSLPPVSKVSRIW